MKTLKGESLADLRHELTTEVNHILGFSDLLIEEAEELNLEAFLPVFRQVRSGGHELLESIQTNLPEETDSAQKSNLVVLQEGLHSKVAQLLETSSSLLENLEHPQALADLRAISEALNHLMEFSESGADPR
jgi:signal transduction histidine kinase